MPHAYCASPVELAARSDILAISTPGGPGTRNLIGQAVFDAMPRGGYLINVARGSVVDTAAMIAALVRRRPAALLLRGSPPLNARVLAAASGLTIIPTWSSPRTSAGARPRRPIRPSNW